MKQQITPITIPDATAVATRRDQFLPDILNCLGGGEFQPLAMRGTVPWRYVINYRVAPRILAAYLPPPLKLDLFDGDGLLSVCVLAIEGMGPPFLPKIFSFETFEVLYRISVVVPPFAQTTHSEWRSFWTLGSLVSSPIMALLGKRWSHYRPRRAHFCVVDHAGLIDMAVTEVSGQHMTFRHQMPSSLTAQVDTITADFVLNVSGSVSVDHQGRIRSQAISHPPWVVTSCQPDDTNVLKSTILQNFSPSKATFHSMFHIGRQEQLWHPMTLLK